MLTDPVFGQLINQSGIVGHSLRLEVTAGVERRRNWSFSDAAVAIRYKAHFSRSLTAEALAQHLRAEMSAQAAKA